MSYRFSRSNPLKGFIDQAIENTLHSATQGPTYFVRPAGSFVVGQTRDKSDSVGGDQIATWLRNLTGWVEVTNQVREMGAGFGQVRYFQAPIPSQYEAYEGVLLWGELTPAQQRQVFVQQAHHAANAEELVAYDIPLKRANIVSILVGAAGNPHEDPIPGHQIVYTWYPGRITPFRKNENLQQQLDAGTRDFYCTVKSISRAKQNPVYVTPKGTAQHVGWDEYHSYRQQGRIPRAIEREAVVEAVGALPEGYSIVQDGPRFRVFFQGQDTGKYGMDSRKAVEIASRMEGGKVSSRATRYKDMAKKNPLRKAKKNSFQDDYAKVAAMQAASASQYQYGTHMAAPEAAPDHSSYKAPKDAPVASDRSWSSGSIDYGRAQYQKEMEEKQRNWEKSWMGRIDKFLNPEKYPDVPEHLRVYPDYNARAFNNPIKTRRRLKGSDIVK